MPSNPRFVPPPTANSMAKSPLPTLPLAEETREAVLGTYSHLKPPPSPSPHPAPQSAAKDPDSTSYLSIERHEAVYDSCRSRHCSFELDKQIVDEKVITHDRLVARHHERQSLEKGATTIHHRELEKLQLLANLTSVQYGFWGDENACLVGLRFQFFGGSKHWRFEKAEVEVRFEGDPPGHPDDDPTILDYAPKKLTSSGTNSTSEYHFSATSPSSPVHPAFQAGTSTTWSTHSFTSIEAADLTSHNHHHPDFVRFWLHEDSKQHDGLPLEFRCAVIVKYATAFRARVSVKTGPVFDLLARPWSDVDPILFEPGIQVGEVVRKDERIVDFAKLTGEEWRRMVTSGLEMDREDIHYAG